MPEGDTIFRTATTLNKWMLGRQVTAAHTKVRGLGIDRIIGSTVDSIEPKAKHLLIRFSKGLVLHTHMRMTGSWHVYSEGERWQKPEYQAKVMLQCGDHIAVCFNAPVVELLMPSEESTHRSLNGLGPDVLGEGELDFAEIRRRAQLQPLRMSIGELLLNQRVVSGIGNIFRAESLFLSRINPFTLWPSIDDEQFDQLISTAVRIMKLNAGPGGDRGRSYEYGGLKKPWVYMRSAKPCRVCGTLIRSKRMGADARTAYWCPTCQPAS